jgi:hypothetical protein
MTHGSRQRLHRYRIQRAVALEDRLTEHNLGARYAATAEVEEDRTRCRSIGYGLRSSLWCIQFETYVA